MKQDFYKGCNIMSDPTLDHYMKGYFILNEKNSRVIKFKEGVTSINVEYTQKINEFIRLFGRLCHATILIKKTIRRFSYSIDEHAFWTEIGDLIRRGRR